MVLASGPPARKAADKSATPIPGVQRTRSGQATAQFILDCRCSLGQQDMSSGMSAITWAAVVTAAAVPSGVSTMPSTAMTNKIRRANIQLLMSLPSTTSLARPTMELFG